jgi:hypothetical protein
MTTRIALVCMFALLAGIGAGCHRGKKAVEPNTPAAEMEALHKQRWVASRSAELLKGGLDQAAAQAKAEQDYASQFTYLRRSTK